MAAQRRLSPFVYILLGIPLVWFAVVVFMAVQNFLIVTLQGGGHLKHNHRTMLVLSQDNNAQDNVNVYDSTVFNYLQPPAANSNNETIGPAILETNVDVPPMVAPMSEDVEIGKIAIAGDVTPDQPFTESPDAPGKGGQPVFIDPETLSLVEKERYDNGEKKHAFNEYVSDLISLHRSLPEVRPYSCQALVYPIDQLPDTSVIVCFHNEAWTVLLRTVHSIIDRSPPQLLYEIILVDDFSDMDHLKRPLEDYMRLIPKVKIVRSTERLGLIRARLLGVKHSKGEVLTFLDSHCECTKGWLEPLLLRIRESWTNVAVPVIDIINDDDFSFDAGQSRGLDVGGFDWNLEFMWILAPERITMKRFSQAEALETPTMAGGLFSIHRDYFDLLGRYDEGMDIWGGENLELSFKIWMCGGNLAIMPCSHVGHVFRERSPYTWGVSKNGFSVFRKNCIRLAEVWLDGYRFYFFETINYNLGDFGDVTNRKMLREKLQCRSFDWYIQNIYPEQFVPNQMLASGDIESKALTHCLDAPVSRATDKTVKGFYCHRQGRNQYWLLTVNNRIRRDSGCFHYNGSVLGIMPCLDISGSQDFEYTSDGLIRQTLYNLCIELGEEGNAVSLRPCDPKNIFQLWKWRKMDLNQQPLHIHSNWPPATSAQFNSSLA